MKISTTTLDFLDGFVYAKTPAEAISMFGGTGFRHLDYGFEFIGGDDDSPFFGHNGEWKPVIEDSLNAAAKIGADFAVAHSHISHEDYEAGGERRERIITQLRNSIEACGMMGIPNIVIHGYYRGNTREEQYESNRVLFEYFSDELEKYNVNGLIENGGEASFLLGAIRHSKNPRMHAVWDIGHANIDCRSQYDAITELGDELRTIHVHDNFGMDYLDKIGWNDCDCHMMPYTGTVNYDEILCALLDSGYTGYFNLEAINALRRHNSYDTRWHYNPRRKWERDSRILNISPRIRVMAEELLYQMAKEMLEAYDCFEE